MFTLHCLFYYGSLIIFGGGLLWISAKSYMLRLVPADTGLSYDYRDLPFSWSKVQLVWWTWIILSSFTAITVSCFEIPDVDPSTLILLGMSAVTFTAAKGMNNLNNVTANNGNGPNQFFSRGFLMDIVTDENGVSLARLQHLLFNFLYGLWYIADVVKHLIKPPGGGENAILPHFSGDDLILIGISSAAYTAIKVIEKRPKKAAGTP